MGRRWLAPETAADLGRLDPEAIARVRERGLARSRERRRIARCAGLARLPRRRRSRGPGWGDWLAASGAGAARRRGCRLPATTVWIAAERLPQFQALWPEARTRPGDRRAGRAMAERDWSRRRGADRNPARPARRVWGPSASARSPLRSGSTPARSRRRCWRSRPKASRCAAASRPARRRTNGASAGCSPASTATRSSACAPRSSRSPRATSCAFCSAGSGSRPTRRWKGRTRSTPSSASSKASRRRPAPGKPRSCRRGSPSTSRPGSTITAWPDGSPGRGCGRATAAAERQPDAPRRRCARRRSRCCRAATPRSGRRSRRPRTPASPAPRRSGSPPAFASSGASFFDELVEGTGLLRPQVEEALAELVALGLVNSDSFGGLARTAGAVRPPARLGAAGAVAARSSAWRTPAAGRWRSAPGRRTAERPGRRRSSMWRAPCCAATASCSGACSSARPPGCRRGAICCASIAGSKRAARSAAAASSPASPASNSRCPRRSACCARSGANRPPTRWVSLSGADPLNLAGILTPGPRLAALTGNRLLYRDGLPIALFAGGEVQFLETLEASEQWQARKALLRGAVPASLIALS